MRSKHFSIGAKCFSAAVATVLSVGVVGQAHGAVSPPFTSSDVNDFTTALSGGATTDTWSSPFEHSFQSSSGVSSAVVDTTGVVGNNFTVSTDFHMVSVSGDTFIIGVAGLSEATTQGDFSGSKFYAATLRFNGSGEHLDIVHDVSNNYASSILSGGQVDVPGSWVAVGSGNYHLSLSGVYDLAGDLTLSATLTDNAANTLTVAAPQITSGVSAGTHFGVRDAAYNGTSGDVQYSNFSIAVPEPASLGLLGVGAMGLLARRRRSA